MSRHRIRASPNSRSGCNALARLTKNPSEVVRDVAWRCQGPGLWTRKRRMAMIRQRVAHSDSLPPLDMCCAGAFRRSAIGPGSTRVARCGALCSEPTNRHQRVMCQSQGFVFKVLVGEIVVKSPYEARLDEHAEVARQLLPALTMVHASERLDECNPTQPPYSQ